MQRSILSCGALALAASLPAQNPLVSATFPASAASAEAPAGGPFPAVPHVSATGGREMLVYPNAEFATLASGPITIERIRFRADGGASGQGGEICRVAQVYLSHASRVHTNLANAFEQNVVGSTRAFGYSGALVATAPGGGTPNDFVTEIPLVRPYVFDPSTGDDLVIDIRFLLAGTSVVALDLQSGFAGGARVVAPFFGDTTGTIDDRVPVFELDYRIGARAASTTFGGGCGRGTGSTFVTTASGLVLGGQSWTGTPAGDTFSVASGSAPFVPPTSPAISTGSLDVIATTLPWPMPTMAGTTNEIHVSTNGWIAFEAPTGAFSPSVLAALRSGPPRIVAYWRELDMFPAGAVHAEPDATDPNLYHVTWNSLPDGLGPTLTAQLSLHRNGSFEVKYTPSAVSIGTVGFSRGAGLGTVEFQDFASVLQTGWQPGSDHLDLALDATARPLLGTTIGLEVSELPPGSTALALLMSRSTISPYVDLSPIGMPGCRLFVGPLLASVALPTFSGSTQTVSLNIPRSNALIGFELVSQVAVAAPIAGAALDAATSNGLTLSIDVN